jgi:Rrf2 family transcriptional regulator, cysteine metabolism repressor
MRFSAKGEYGILALLELAIQNSRGPVQARTISKNQRIPLRFLEQVLSSLKKAGLVESVRGAQGGYFLSKAPEQIRIGEVFEAIEGPIPPISCTSGGMEPYCWHEIEQGHCVIKEVWKDVRSSIQQVMDSTSLKDLHEQKKLKEQNRALIYHI